MDRFPLVFSCQILLLAGVWQGTLTTQTGGLRDFGILFRSGV